MSCFTTSTFRALTLVLCAILPAFPCRRQSAITAHLCPYVCTLQLAQRVGGDPASAGGIAGTDALRGPDGEAVQPRVALAYLSQRPIDRLAHVGTIVVGCALDHRQQRLERGIVRRL